MPKSPQAPLKPECAHFTLKPNTCLQCRAFQEIFYSKIATTFKDIEYGRDDYSSLKGDIDVNSVDDVTMSYYDSIWAVYHAWVAEGRTASELAVAELLAKQEGKTGTWRGIADYLKRNKMRPSSYRWVRLKVKEIKTLISTSSPLP